MTRPAMLCAAVLVSVIVQTAWGSMLLSSPVFHNFEGVPKPYGCDDVFREHAVMSPPLEWFRAPTKTQSFVLMIDDVDSNGFVHWIVKDIPRDVASLPADASGLKMPEGAVELRNSWNEAVYGGLCPPANTTHTYRFRLYARSTNESNLVVPSIDSGIHISSELYDEQLIKDDRTLYCAVLVGTFRTEIVPAAVLDNVNSSQAKTIRTTGPIPVVRYLKPSETRRNPRKHYGPRPYGVYPYNTTAFCERKRAAKNPPDEEYAQLCNATRVSDPSMAARILEKVDDGGEEEVNPKNPYEDLDSNDLLSNGGIRSRYFDLHRFPTPKAWVISDSGVPTPPAPADPVDARDPTDKHNSAAKSAAASKAGTNVLLSPENSNNGANDQQQSASNFGDPLASGFQELRRLGVEVVQWECSAREEVTPLLLRSPVMDSCNNSQQIVSTMPVEFVCDTTSGRTIAQRLAGEVPSDEDDVTSPPLMWALATDRHPHPSPLKELLPKVKSFVMFLEDLSSHRVHWILNDIAGYVRSLGVGASRTSQLPNGAVELANSFHVPGYTSPCVDPQVSTKATHNQYRFHLFARADAKTSLPEGVVKGNLDGVALAVILEDSIAHATLDFVVVVPEQTE
eukprot:c5414_g1_i1.p1 GENE.c5414_g1_i1~~c5414_g1_i1.p1  ORF type:complete len:632 (+),score=162.90 c5414_g1_i1:29-1897(+)